MKNDDVIIAPGGVLRFMRECAGLSQRGLSSAIDRNASFISVVENPDRDPSLSTVCRVASACGYGLGVYDRTTGATVAKIEAPDDDE